MNVQNIRDLFAEKYKNNDFEIDKFGGKVIDIICNQFIADEEYIFSKPNYEYIEKEIKWYLSESLNVNNLEDTPKIWKSISDNNGYINSNYGWCVFSKENGYQYDNCLVELKNQRSSRRGAMIYNRPEMWKDYNTHGRDDFMCTYAVQYLIRNNVLYANVLMRSNDAWAGYRNDYAWQKYVVDKLADDLNIDETIIIWNASSLHIYENQFYLLDHYIKTGETHITKTNYNSLYK